MSIKYIKKFRGVNFVYKIPLIGQVTKAFIKKTEWPKEAKGVLFEFQKIGEKDHEILWKNIGDRYFCRLYYYANKKNIKVEDINRPRTIKRHMFKTKNELEKTYMNTIALSFWKPWEKYRNKFYNKKKSEEIIKNQAKNDLKKTRIISHEKNEKIVSFLAYYPVLVS